MKRSNSIVNPKGKSSPPYSTAKPARQIKKKAAIKPTAVNHLKTGPDEADAKVWRAGRLGKTGRILSFGWTDMTRAEAEAAVKDSRLSIIPLADILALPQDEQEARGRDMGHRAHMRLYDFQRVRLDGRWNTLAVRLYPELNQARQFQVWVLTDRQGRVCRVDVNEQWAGWTLENSSAGYECYLATVTVPKKQTLPRPGGKAARLPARDNETVPDYENT